MVHSFVRFSFFMEGNLQAAASVSNTRSCMVGILHEMYSTLHEKDMHVCRHAYITGVSELRFWNAVLVSTYFICG